jgi:L-ascorbate metabolism protein UlaG (beta-lactamase superfamily)
MTALDDVDVLLIPVGKRFTLDAAEAMTVIAQVSSAKIVLPMHFKVAGITPWDDMAPLTEFTRVAEVMYPVVEADDATVTLDADDLPDTTEVWILNYIE